MAVPKWREALSQALQKALDHSGKDALNYNLATLTTQEPSGYAPAVRTVVHRGFVNERRSDGDASSNDHSMVSNALLTCTDLRSAKAAQILAFKEQGVPAELCWWFEPSSEQFRIKGRLFILSPPSEGQHNAYWPGDRLVPSASFDWEQERVRIYDKISSTLKATFLRPTPGSPLSSDPRKPEDFAATLPEGDKEARQQSLMNFGLMALDPEQVDYCNLKQTPHIRIIHRKEGDQWQSVDVWP